MPEFVVEHRDGRVFPVEAETAAEALTHVARQRRLHPGHLRSMPRPRVEHEWGIPFFMILLTGFTLMGVVLILI
jgi:hypothetical protein